MSNQALPNLPGFGAIAETMELVRNMWGGMSAPGIGIPGMVMPTLSVDEINKQISDLKAVESWLTLNMNMLRGTIQALEVQSATISTLKTMGETLSASVKPAAAAAAKPQASSAFSYPFGTAASPAPAAEAPSVPKAAPPAPPAPAIETQSAPEPADELKKSAKDKTTAAGSAAFTAPLANPAAWWNLLQDQFKQAVGSALATDDSTGKKSAGTTSKSGRSGTTQSDATGKSAARRAPAAAKKSTARATRKPAAKAASVTGSAAPRSAATGAKAKTPGRAG